MFLQESDCCEVLEHIAEFSQDSEQPKQIFSYLEYKPSPDFGGTKISLSQKERANSGAYS
jgi:hypothetical protein